MKKWKLLLLVIFISMSPLMVYASILSDNVNINENEKVSISKIKNQINSNNNDFSATSDDENFDQNGSTQVDCGIFSGEFGQILKTILSFIRFLVPILIIVLGIKDFIGAIASQDDTQMKKAFKNLVIRIAIGLIIFLLPTLINFLLKLADVDSGLCGIK